MDPKVDAYFKKQKSPQKEICDRLRKLIFKINPEVKEEMKWGVPAYAGDKCYIVALKDHVNLGFDLKSLNKEQLDLLKGNGKIMRHLEFDSVEAVDKEKEQIKSLFNTVF